MQPWVAVLLLGPKLPWARQGGNSEGSRAGTEGSCVGDSEGSRAGKTPCALPVAPPCSWYKLILQENQEGARGLVMDGMEAQG